MKQTTTAILVAFALRISTQSTVAEPFEDTPDAAARDPDYAAGKAAMEKKNWTEAAKRFHQAALRDPDSADLHNYLGFSYRNLKLVSISTSSARRGGT